MCICRVRVSRKSTSALQWIDYWDSGSVCHPSLLYFSFFPLNFLLSFLLYTFSFTPVEVSLRSGGGRFKFTPTVTMLPSEYLTPWPNLQGIMHSFVSGSLMKSSSPGMLVQKAKCECHQCFMDYIVINFIAQSIIFSEEHLQDNF